MDDGSKDNNEWVRARINESKWEPLKAFLGKLLEPEEDDKTADAMIAARERKEG
jgi:hypothetical protein